MTDEAGTKAFRAICLINDMWLSDPPSTLEEESALLKMMATCIKQAQLMALRGDDVTARSVIAESKRAVDSLCADIACEELLGGWS